MIQEANFISNSIAVNGCSNAIKSNKISSLNHVLPMFDTLANVQKRQLGYIFFKSSFTEKTQHITESVIYNSYMKPLQYDTNNTSSHEGCCA